MQSYVYIGSGSEIGTFKLDRFGQTIGLNDETATQGVCGGAALLPEERFSALGFTPDELKTVSYPGQRETAAPEVKAKVTEAYKAFAAYRQELGEK